MRRILRERWVPFIVILASLALVATACGGSDDEASDNETTTTSGAADTTAAPGDTTETTTAPEPTEPPTAGGDLVVGRTGDIDIVDPHLATAFQTFRTLELVFDTLLGLDQDLAVVPALAQEWAFSDDGMTLTLTLMDGVKFHDGSAFDSADVVASLERVLDEATGAVARSNVLGVVGIEAPDAGTVVLELAGPDASILATLADVNLSMLSSDAIAAGTVDREPVGTGAFKWSEWKQGTSVTLAANGDYWRDGPFVDSIEFRVIPDESSVLSGLKAGEIHLAPLTDPVIVLQASDPLVVYRTPALSYHVLMLNGDREPMTDVKVRQAISCAVNRQEVIDSAALGEGAVTGPITIPAYRSDTDGLPCGGERDVERAKSLLTEAGFGSGITLNTIVIAGETSTATAEGEALQSQLAEAGINLELEVLETGTYVDRWLAADFDAAVALNGGRPDPHPMYVRYWTSDGNLNSVAGYRSDTLDQLMADGQTETDPAKRVAAYDALSEELQTQVPWVWVFTGYEYRVTDPSVSGFVPMPNGSLQYLRQTAINEQ